MSRPDVDDPNVAEALRDGRTADDIMLFNCPSCGAINYCNDSSHATCNECEWTGPPEDIDTYTLADYWTFAPYPDVREEP